MNRQDEQTFSNAQLKKLRISTDPDEKLVDTMKVTYKKYNKCGTVLVFY